MRTGPPPGAAFALPLATVLSPPLSPPLSAPLPLGARSAFAAGAPAAAAAAGFSAFGALAGFSSLAAFSALGFFSSAIDLGSRTLGKSHLLAVRLDLEADAGRLAVLGIGECDVRQVDGELLGDDAAFLLRGLARVALDHVDAAHQGAVVVRAHLDHLAAPALVAAGEHDDLVALADLCGHHNTSGASEMIFMWFLARNSRGTGPKMRVPTGSICGVISTAGLRSKRMIEPSGRRRSLATRTTTAFITSPFFTRPRGIASLTETTITSPTVAYLRLDPPSTLMHMTRRAPELSATSRLVCIWIMTLSRSFLVRRQSFGACSCQRTGFHFAGTCARRSRYFLLLLAPDHGPALELGDRAMLLDPHHVTDRVLVRLVVRVVLLGAPHRLLEQRMGEPPLDAHHARLRLLVAHHDALQHSLRHIGLLTSTSAARRASAAPPSGYGRCRGAPGARATYSRAGPSRAGSAG